MTAFVLRRVLAALPVLLLVTMLAFGFLHLAPGDPVDVLLPADQRGVGSEQLIEALRHEYGLDQSLPAQYLAWLKEIAVGNLGTSFTSGQPVTELIGERIGATLLLMAAALTCSLLVGVPLGVLAALRKDGLADRIIGAISMTAMSIPSFFMALIAISIFALTLGWLPSAGMETPGGAGGLGDTLWHLVLPAAVFSTLLVGPNMRFTRQAMVEVLSEDYMRTARAMGIPPRRRHFVHALRNALIPLSTVVFVQLGVFIGGAVIMERIFSWPGMGDLMLDSLSSQDYPVILAIALLTAVAVLFANLAADLVAAVLDPRIRNA